MAQSPIHPALSDTQVFALINEAKSAQNLMRDAVDAVRNFQEPTAHSDAVFTLGSIGVEKTLKVMLGCVAVETDGAWPSLARMKQWGHDVETLAATLMTVARERAHLAVANNYMTQLIERVDGSETLSLLFATLSRYGRSGRFYYLDVLATDEIGRFDPPGQYWERLEAHVAGRLGGIPYGSVEEFDAFIEQVSSAIAVELDTWWFFVHRLGIQGCLGPLGKTFGWEIWPFRRPDPTSS